MEKLEEFPQEQDVMCKRIFGGIAAPSATAAGFAVVIGETVERGFGGKPKLVFLDEAESWDSRELVESVGFLNLKYRPQAWLGDTKDVALDAVICETNAEITIPEASRGKRKLSITKSELLFGEKPDDRPFALIVPRLNQLLDKARQRLFIAENSKLMSYLKAPQPGDAVAMTFNEHPAISALAFAVFELERPVDIGIHEDCDNEYERN